MQIFANNKLAYNQLWKNSWDLYKKTFWHIWWLGFLTGLLIIGFDFLQPIMAKAVKNEKLLSTFLICVGVFLLLVRTLLNNALVYQVYQKGSGKSLTWGRAFHFVLNKYWRLVLGLLCVSIITFLAGFAFLLPGIFLYILLIFTQFFILLENHEVIAAIKASCNLVWQNWWRTFLLLLPLFLLSLLFAILMFLLQHKYLYVYAAINLFISTFYIPLFYCLLLVQFNDLKIMKN